LKFSFASPFAEDQTQVVPRFGGNMKSRAVFYTLGGLMIEGTALLVVAIATVVLACIGKSNYFLIGILPYFGYLFLLNALPFEYASGKTDALVYRGIKKGNPAENAMLTAMEIQGQLYAGKTFAKIDETLYQSFPQLPENEPLFAVVLHLKYRYYLDKNDLENAADCLNRLVNSQEYLSDLQVQQVAAELLYLHAIRHDQNAADACAKYCQEYLQGENITAKRALAAYSKAFGKEDAVAILIEQAEEILQKERIQGLVLAERKLLARLLA
jgi:hypothetical protein